MDHTREVVCITTSALLRTVLNLSLPVSITETCNVVLTVESVDKILWCDHSSGTSLAALLHGTMCFSVFYKIEVGIFLEF